MEETALMPKRDEDSALEVAYRTTACWLNEPLGVVSKAIPRMPDLEQITGSQLKALVEEYDIEIKLLKDVLSGKKKSRFTVISPSHDSLTAQQAKQLEQERQADKEILEKGIAILKHRRNKLSRKLQILRLKQPLVYRKLAETKQLVEKAEDLRIRIIEETGKLRQMLSEMDGLRSKYNIVCDEFHRTNLDPEKQLPAFNVEVPRAIRQLLP